MWKKVLGLNNPLGWVVAGATVLVFSEDARKGTRKAVVKSVGAAMYLGDRVKGFAVGNGFGIQHLLEDARKEKQQMRLSDGGLTHSVKEGVSQAADATMDTYSKTKEKIGQLFDQPHEQTQPAFAANVMNDEAMQAKLSEIAEEFHMKPPNDQ